jgi:hypothetical protein
MNPIPSSYINFFLFIASLLLTIYGKITHKKFTWITFIIAMVFGGLGLYFNWLNDVRNNQAVSKPGINTTSPPKPDVPQHSQVPSSVVQAKASIPEPIMTCILDEHPSNKGFLLFTIKNEGPTSVKSVSVDSFTMRYMKKERKIKMIEGGGGDNKFEYNEPGRNWLFLPELSPNDHSSKLAGESVWPDESVCVNVLYFDVKFLTEEKALREKECIFFVEGNRIYTYTEYKTHEKFPHIEQEIKRALSKVVPGFRMLGKHKRQ